MFERVWIARVCSVVMVTVLVSAAMAARVDAQTVGTFKWKQEPYCNVVTLTVTITGGIFQLDGFDDQCGAPTQAAAVGIAFPNVDGTIGMGLTIVTTPSGTPVHIDATVNLATVSGTWRDSSGVTGPWTFTSGPGGGAPRPAPRAAFPAGLSAGGSTITAVASPVNANDAATKAYVDSSVAAAQTAAQSALATGLAAAQAALDTGLAQLRALATASLNVSADGFVLTDPGQAFTTAAGCVGFGNASGGTIRVAVPLPIGATITSVSMRSINNSPSPLFLKFYHADFVPGVGASEDFIVSSSTDGNSGARTDVIINQPLPPVSATRSYFMIAQAVAHTGLQQFCGAQISYTMP